MTFIEDREKTVIDYVLRDGIGKNREVGGRREDRFGS